MKIVFRNSRVLRAYTRRNTLLTPNFTRKLNTNASEGSIGGVSKKTIAFFTAGVLGAAGALVALSYNEKEPLPTMEELAKEIVEENVPAVTQDDLSKLEEKLEALSKELNAKIAALEKHNAINEAGAKNAAFLFIKPHAVTDEVEKLVQKKLASFGVKVRQTGEILSEDIDKKLLIDTHYGAIASKAAKLDPSELVLSDKAKADFEKMAGMSWEDAIKNKKVYNAKQYCESTGLSADELDSKWSKLTRGSDLIKFGGGFYCGKVDDEFVINGFYMTMRSKYTAPGQKIKYMLVEFSPSSLSWGKFRNEVLGGTDPETATEGSIRNTIFKEWEKLGLKAVPNTGDNGVHASASPFEGFAERVNWLSQAIDEDTFGKAIKISGVDASLLEKYMADESVEFEGKKQSCFDLLEDLDAEDCLEKLLLINAQQK